MDVKDKVCPTWFTEYFGKGAVFKSGCMLDECIDVSFCQSSSSFVTNGNFKGVSCGSTKPTNWPNNVTDAILLPTFAPHATSAASVTFYVVSTIVTAGLSLVLA